MGELGPRRPVRWRRSPFFKSRAAPGFSGTKHLQPGRGSPSGRLWVLSSRGLGTLEKGKWRVDPEIRQYEPMHPSRSDGIFSHPSATLAVMASGQAFRISGDGQRQQILLPEDDAAGEAGLAWLGNRLVVNRRGRFWRRTAMPGLPCRRFHFPRRSCSAVHCARMAPGTSICLRT